MSRRRSPSSSVAVVLLMLGIVLQHANARPAHHTADARFLLAMSSSQAAQSKMPASIPTAILTGKNNPSPQVVQVTSDASITAVTERRRQQQQHPKPTQSKSAKNAGKSNADTSTGRVGKQQQVGLPVQPVAAVNSLVEAKKLTASQPVANKPTYRHVATLSKDMLLEDDEFGMNLPAELSDSSLQVMLASIPRAPRPKTVRTSSVLAATTMPAAGDISDIAAMHAGEVVVDGY